MDQQKPHDPKTIFTPVQQHNSDMSVSESAQKAYSRAHLEAVSSAVPSAHTSVNTSALFSAAADARADLSEKLVPIEIRTVKTRKELALTSPKLHTEKFNRWNQIPELQNRQSLEVMLNQYRDVGLVAHVLNCSKHMVYKAMNHHGVTYPRAYSSKKTRALLGLPDSRTSGLK